MQDSIVRLTQAVAAVAPITGIGRDSKGNPFPLFVDKATDEDRKAAQAALDSFDDSDEAQAAWEKEQAAAAAAEIFNKTNDPLIALVTSLHKQVAELQGVVNDLVGGKTAAAVQVGTLEDLKADARLLLNGA